MRGRLWGLLTVVDAADDHRLRTGALQRCLAESVWLPTALLPGDRLRWHPIDDTHARATLVDGEIKATLDFEFGPTGDMVGCSTLGRPRLAREYPGGYAILPWGGRYRNYEWRGSVRVPLESEVYWVVAGREQPYYRGRNLQIVYDFAPSTRETIASASNGLSDS
jgi:hypothetical protein